MSPRPLAVVTSAHPWGDPRVFGRELQACLDWGLPVDLYAQAPPGAAPALPAGLRFHPVPPARGRLGRVLRALGLWRPLLRNGPYRLVHFHDPELLPAMALLALARPGTHLLFDIHEDLPLQFRAKTYVPEPFRRPLGILAAWALHLASRLFHGFAPATEAIASAWPPDATRVVHNYPRTLFHRPGPAPDPDRVLYMGGLSRERGLLLALEAVRRARAVRPGMRLEVIGWLLDREVEAALGAASAEGWCTHTPTLGAEALAERASGAGIGLVTLLPLANYQEALPTKLFEYMALGIPVLASDFPLWRRLVAGSGAGRVAAPEPAAVAGALLAMASDPAGLAAHARRGREAYLARYRWEAEARHLRWHLARAGLLPPEPPGDAP
ncbi:glycosyltransferase family 4 protein [Mesoterricola sediminis]|uniref:Glycosyltransferase WbpH n=1 Tax=Mesoterricola sediminis TaxID=2927980 RepID=A0AA48GTM8_9BACT|nr:glycosyltransferase family 4 protein [Mesoterricola sediminis]BDU75445.1 glycosyltransferase WbpH [Mesoterricola sediminis]